MADCTYKIFAAFRAYVQAFRRTRRIAPLIDDNRHKPEYEATRERSSKKQANTPSVSSIMTLSSATPGLYYDENAELPPHASLTYQEVKAAGPPAQPLDFPTPTVHRALPVSGRAMDHRYGNVYRIQAMSRTDQRIAYLFKKNIAKTTYGCVKLCVVLRRRSHKFEFRLGEAEWISTDEMVAIKASSWSKMRKHRGRHLEDPLKGTCEWA